MPIVAALAAIFVIAATFTAGQQIGNDAGLLFRMTAVPTAGLVIFALIYLYHRRRSRELIVARYHLKGDALGWRRVRLQSSTYVRVCAECGALVPDFHAQEQHAEWHEDLATLLAGEQLGQDQEVPWSAATEESSGQDDTAGLPRPDDADESIEPGTWARFLAEVRRR